MGEGMAKSNEKSHLLIENIKKKKLQEIFLALDSDGDGLISSTKIDISAIETGVLEMLAPLLCEMEELHQSLTFDRFLDATEKLLRVKNMKTENK